MKITNVAVYPVTTSAKVKANGVVTLEEAVELKFIIMAGPKGDFISWAGGKPYEKKDGTKGWDSPIFIKDKAFNDDLTKQVMAKYSARGASTNASRGASTPANSGHAVDDIPF